LKTTTTNSSCILIRAFHLSSFFKTHKPTLYKVKFSPNLSTHSFIFYPSGTENREKIKNIIDIFYLFVLFFFQFCVVHTRRRNRFVVIS